MDDIRDKDEVPKKTTPPGYGWPPSEDVLHQIVAVDLTAGKDPADDRSLFEFPSESPAIASEPVRDGIVAADLPDRTRADAASSRPSVDYGLSPFERAQIERGGASDADVH